MKVKRMGKRVLSIVLCLTMLITTFCIFDIGSLMSSAAASSGDVLFYVPETIYLKPSMTSFKDTTTASFQYFVQNNVVDGNNLKSEPEVTASSDRVSGNTTGYVYFQCSTAESASLSYSYEGGSGSVSCTSLSKTGNYYKSTINRNSSSATLGASVTGCYIKWTVEYKDTADGQTKQVSAYTYVYKPYVTPYGSGAKAANDDGWGDNYHCEVDTLSWVTGVHSIAANDANYYARFRTENNGATLAGFLSDENVTGNSDNIGRWTNPNTSYPATYASTAKDMYRIYASSDTSVSYFKDDASDNWFGDWLTTNTADGSYSIPTFNGVEMSDGAAYVTSAASSKALGTLYIDTSRYTNLNQIPNLGAGFIVTKAWNVAANRLAWYAADVSYLADDLDGTNWKEVNDYWRQSGNTKAHSLWYNCSSIIATSAQSLDIPTMETDGKGGSADSGLRYTGSWTADIDASQSTKYYYFRGVAVGEPKNRDEWTTASSTVRLRAIQIDKSSLRTAVNESLKKFAYYGIYNDNGTYKSYSSKVADDKVPAFVAALEAAQKGLVTLDADCDTNALIKELANTEAQLTAISYSSAAFIAPEVIYLTPAQSGGQSFQYYVNNNVSIDTSAQTANVSTSSSTDTTGKLYFYYPDAKDGSVSLTYSYAGSVTTTSLSKDSNGLYTANITAGSSNSYASGYITWTMKYTDEADGYEKALTAYTYVYAPYVYTAAAATTVFQQGTNWGSKYNSRVGVTSMIYGVHGMLSTGTKMYLGTAAAGTTPDGTGYLNTFPLINNSSYTPSLYCSNSAPTFYSEGGEGFAYWCANTNEDSQHVSGGNAQLFVDTSRYTSFGQIPNFTLRADYNGHYYNKEIRDDSGNYWAKYYTISGSATSTNTVLSTSDNYFSGREIKQTTNTGVADLSGLAISGVDSIINHAQGVAHPRYSGDDTSYANAYSACQIVKTNKSALRAEVQAATAAMPSFAIKSDFTSYFGYNSARLTRFVNAYKAAYQGLTKLDGAVNAEALRAELYNARMDLPNATFKMDFNAGSDYVYYKHGDNDFGAQVSPVETYDTVIGSMFGTKASFPSPHRVGYNFLGWYTRNDGTTEEVKAAQPVTMLLPEDVRKLEEVNAYTVDYQDGVTLYARWEKADEQLLLDNLFNFDTFASKWLANSAATSTANKADMYFNSTAGTAKIDWIDRSITLTATGNDCYTGTMSYSASAGDSYAIPGLEKGETYALIFDYDASAPVTLAPYVNVATTGTNFQHASAAVSAGTGTMALSFTVPDNYNGSATLRLGFTNGSGATVTFSDISVSKRYQKYDEYADDAIDSTTIKEANKPFDVYWLIDDTNTSDNYAVSTSDNARIVDTRNMDTVTAAGTLSTPKCNNPLLVFVGWDDANVAPTGDYNNPDSANSTWILKADYSELSAQLNIAEIYVDLNQIFENGAHGDHHDYFEATSYAAFVEALTAAQEAKNYNGGDLNADRQPYIDKVAANLKTAFENLTPYTACYDELNEILSTANGKVTENNEFAGLHDSTEKFTSASLAALQEAIDEANALDKNITYLKSVDAIGVYDNGDEYIIIQKQIDDVTAKLTAAVNGLEYADAYTQKLKETVDKAVKLKVDLHSAAHDPISGTVSDFSYSFDYEKYVPEEYCYWREAESYQEVLDKITEINSYLATNHKTNEQETIDNYITELNNLYDIVVNGGINDAYLVRINAAVAKAEEAIAKQATYQSTYSTDNYYWSNTEYDAMVSQYNAVVAYLDSAHTTEDQVTINDYTKALEDCIAALTLNRADYTSVDAELANAQPYIDLWSSYNHADHHDYYVAADYNALTALMADVKDNKYQYAADKQSDVNALAAAIKVAYTKLSPVEACFDELEAKIAQASVMIVDVAETEFYASLEAAKELAETKGTGQYTTLAESQKVIDDAEIRLDTAINSLQKRDTTEMRKAYSYGLTLIEEHYTRSTWKAFDTELKNLKKLIEMDDNNQFYASEARIHDEAQKLYTAASNLKYEYTSNPDDDTDDDKSYGDETPVIIGGDSNVTVSYQTKSNIPYRICTVTAPITNDAGESFSWWVDKNGSVVSSYRSYSFYACSSVTLTPVYGQSNDDVVSHYAAMRVVGVRNNNNITYTGVYSILVERSMSKYLNPAMTQHGVIYSKDRTAIENAASANYPTVGTSPADLGDDVYAPCASKTATSRNGLFEVQVKLNAGDTIYMRPYVMIGSEYYYFDVAEYTAAPSLITSSEDSDIINLAMNVDEFAVEQIVADDETDIPTTDEPTVDEPTVDVPTDTEDVLPNVSWLDTIVSWLRQIIGIIVTAIAKIF